MSLTLLRLKLDLFGRPQRLQIGDDRANLFWREHVVECGHGEFRRLVEWVSPPLAHHHVELGIRVPPGVAFCIVWRRWQLSVLIALLPIRCALGIGSMARCAMLLVYFVTGLHEAGIDRWRHIGCTSDRR